MKTQKNQWKTPNLKEKVEKYEKFLHSINLGIVCGNHKLIQELLQNADTWSYVHRCGNGEYSPAQQQQLINAAFWKLCETTSENNQEKKTTQNPNS